MQLPRLTMKEGEGEGEGKEEHHHGADIFCCLRFEAVTREPHAPWNLAAGLIDWRNTNFAMTLGIKR